MRFIFILLSLLIFANLTAQNNADYDWDEGISSYTPPDSLKDEPEIILHKFVSREFKIEDNAFIEYFVYHVITWVNSDDAIESNNKIYLPMDIDEDLIRTKARTFTPDGKVIELERDDIIESQEEEDVTLHYFPMKGVEKGSIIEFYYVQKSGASYKGTRVLVQEDAPLFDATYEIITPEHLVFAVKGYNGFGEMERDTNITEVNVLRKHFDYIPKYEHEEGAFPKANAVQFVFKLDRNTANGSKDLVSYSDVAKMLIEGYTTGDKKEVKSVSKVLGKLGVNEMDDPEKQIRTIEVYLKSNITIVDAYGYEDLEDITLMFKNKYANPRAIMKFMAIACDELNIPYNFVMTSSRKTMPFDKEFEAYCFLQKYLIYFPDINLYMDPENNYNALGFVPTFYQDNYGVFFSKVGLGEIFSGVAKIKYIEGRPAMASQSNMDVTVTVNDDFGSLHFEHNASLTGYEASGMQPVLNIMEPDERTDLLEAIVKSTDENMNLLSIETENEGLEYLGVKPLIIKSKYDVESFIIKAGNKYLIKIGLFIGPQVEMYQDAEKPRTMPVGLSYRKSYHRVLKFIVPDGYNLSNLEDLNMEVLAKDKDGKVIADFISTYTLDGNTLTVTVDERYYKVRYEVSEFEGYRNVINAAADFNKIVIFLENN